MHKVLIKIVIALKKAAGLQLKYTPNNRFPTNPIGHPFWIFENLNKYIIKEQIPARPVNRLVRGIITF